VVHEQKDKQTALEIPTFQTIFQVLTIPAYLWLKINRLRNFLTDGLSQDKSCEEIIIQ